MKYWAFISYSHQDRAWGDWLHKAIERYRVPRHLSADSATGEVPARLYPVFRDRDELPGSADLGSAINEALRESRYQIVICSPRSAASRWVNEEVRYFKSLGREDRVICLIVDGEPNATDRGDASNECFAPALRFRVSRTGELTSEAAHPVAADARAHGDGRDNARLKVIAGLLGVGYDALRQREQRRRSRLMFATAATAAASLAIAAVTSALAFSAYHARNDARVQAERVQRTKDFFVSIFANSDPLRKADSSPETVASALEDALQRVDTDFAADPRLQADLLDDFGEIRAGRGDLAGAKAMFQRALPLHEATLDADSPVIANTLVNLGAIENYMGHTLDGRPFLERAVAILEHHADTEGDALSNARNGLASVYREEGRYADAIAQMEKSLAFYREHPGPKERRLGITLGNLGGLVIQMDRDEQARAYFTECVSVIERNLGPKSAVLSDCLYGLAEVSARAHDVAGQVAYSERLSQIAEESFPGDHPWRARAIAEMGSARIAQGRMDEGEALLRQAIDMFTRAHVSENRVLPVRAELAQSRLRRGDSSEAARLVEVSTASCAQASMVNQRACETLGAVRKQIDGGIR